MTGSHDPTGLPPLPPPWLRTTSLPILDLPHPTSAVRIHHLDYDPVFFSPGKGKPPVGRFDSLSGSFGVLYLSQAFEGAFAETILRNPHRRLVDLSDIMVRAVSVLQFSRPVRLVKLLGDGLQAVGTDNSVSTGPYSASWAWADALFSHPDTPDGIAYISRHDPDQICIALFDRPGLALDQISGPTALSDIMGDVASALRRYKKGVA